MTAPPASKTRDLEMRIAFADLLFDLPAGWIDITSDLPEGTPPTLGRESASGCIQFTTATYSSGVEPSLTENGLQAMLDAFCAQHDFDAQPLGTPSTNLTSVGMLSTGGGETVAAWYLSNGLDVSFVTYVDDGSSASETREGLAAAKALVRSIEFSLGRRQ